MPTLLEHRCRRFALRVLSLVKSLPHTSAAEVVANQLVRSATSIEPHLRAARQSNSRRQCKAKLTGAETCVDESTYWLSLLLESEIIDPNTATPLLREAEDLTSALASGQQRRRRAPTLRAQFN